MTHGQASARVAELLAAADLLRDGGSFTATTAATTLATVVQIVDAYLTNPTAVVGGITETEDEDG